ncbi:hypothetical protein BDN72DRAFT_816616 [Pluteus cervinus]|uniref:Uncharacterized protein n=1 Tax=Pluteus cervinus TaxID=181527 RepID=A0ACD3B324_9AGAR|nr:hypothetical protein BDN72DRAFT_816616 [Pluteus cervinus]
MSFENASVTKGIMVASALTSILVGLFDIKHYFHLQYVPHLSRHHQAGAIPRHLYWRLAVHHLAFSNSSELFVSEIILGSVGVQIERQFGSVKFASFAVVITILVTILEFLALILFHRFGLNYIAMGPAALLFSILYQHSRVVPSIYQYRIFGLSLNNKSFTYFLALQLALSRLPGSACVALIGILAGQIYRSDLANLKSYRLSPSVVRFFARFLLPLVGTSRPLRRSTRALPDGTNSPSDQNIEPLANETEEVVTTARTSTSGSRSRNQDATSTETGTGPSVMREWVDELTGRAERANAGIRIPSEVEITTLTAMFPDVGRDVVVAALQRSPNVEAAVETLLSSQR